MHVTLTRENSSFMHLLQRNAKREKEEITMKSFSTEVSFFLFPFFEE